MSFPLSKISQNSFHSFLISYISHFILLFALLKKKFNGLSTTTSSFEINAFFNSVFQRFILFLNIFDFRAKYDNDNYNKKMMPEQEKWPKYRRC